MAKQLTREQVATRKAKAVRFLRDVLDDPDRAAEVEDESIESYAARRHFKLSNPNAKGVREMPQERLADVVADRDELLGKVADLRDLADDILSEYETPDEAEEAEDDGGNGDDEDTA
jgi:hypothetical protein